MFTGIISSVAGVVENIDVDGGKNLVISCVEGVSDVQIGDSIAISGCCLTVVKKFENNLTFFVSEETMRCTTMPSFVQGAYVNFEKAILPTRPLGGHIVLGHVDEMARVVEFEKLSASARVTLEISKKNAGFVMMKGSITIDGVSLTAMEVFRNFVTLNIIPHTLENTTLKFLGVKSNNIVNVEFDQTVKVICSVVNEYFKRNS